MSHRIVDNMKLARSRVFDAEYTIETSRLAKQQILHNAATAMLAQANIVKTIKFNFTRIDIWFGFIIIFN